MYYLKTHCCETVICTALSVDHALVRARHGGFSLRGVSLRHFWLHRLDFSGMDLRDSDLKGSQFLKSNFRGADLRGANVDFATFHECDFLGANLEGVDFEEESAIGATGMVRVAIAEALPTWTVVVNDLGSYDLQRDV